MDWNKIEDTVTEMRSYPFSGRKEVLAIKVNFQELTQQEADEVLKKLNGEVKSVEPKKPLFIKSKIKLGGGMGDLPKRQFLVERLAIEKNYLYLFCAGSGSGKTMFLQYLACCIKSGKALFGEFPVAKGDVYHLDQEQGEVQTTRRYRRIAEWMGLGPEQEVERVSITASLDNREVIKTIEDELVEEFKGKTLVIIDSLKAISEAKENDPEISEICRIFKKAAERADTTIILIHHMGKIGTTPRGHSSIKDSCDGVIDLTLDKEAKTYTISFDKVRDGEEPLGLSYRLNDEGERDLQQNCSEKLAFELLVPSVKPKEIDRLKHLLQILDTSATPLTQLKLGEILSIGRDAYKAIRKLAIEKKFVLEAKDPEGTNKLLYSITEEGKTHLAWILSSEDCK